MDQARFDDTMGRISQALKRTELAAEALIAHPRGPTETNDAHLRARVSAALGELDELIESLAP